MKKFYVKPELDTVFFELEDVIAASTGQQSVLDNASNGFEKMADGVLDFFYNLGNP